MIDAGDSGFYEFPQLTDLRAKALAGIGWVTLAQLLQQLLRFLISVILARLLTPRDFGLLGMIAVFTGFATLFSDMGFGAALIHREDLEERHLSSVLWLNAILGLLLAVLFLLIAPLVARFYHEPKLSSLTMLMAVNFVITPLGSVQTTILRRAMNFRRLAFIQVFSVLVSGSVAIAMACRGYGTQSLVWQILAASSVTVILLWVVTKWRPRLSIDRSALRDLFGFSANLLGFNIVNYWVRKSDNLFVGRFIGGEGLGIYSRAYSTMMLPLSQITAVLGRVMFPALSRVQNDNARLKRIYLRSISLIALATFPLMLGLLVVSEPFVLALYGPKWSAVIPIIRILSPLGMVQSIGATVGWIYQSKGRTDLFFRWGVAAGALLIGSIALGIWLGTVASVALCYAITSGVVLLYPSFAIPGRLINMGFWEVAGTVGSILGCALAMALLVWGLGLLLPADWPYWAYLAIQVPVGVAVYWSLVHLFKVPAYQDVRALAYEQWHLHQGRRTPGSRSTEGAP
jgi:PST family polysaccharide transporter